MNSLKFYLRVMSKDLMLIQDILTITPYLVMILLKLLLNLCLLLLGLGHLDVKLLRCLLQWESAQVEEVRLTALMMIIFKSVT